MKRKKMYASLPITGIPIKWAKEQAESIKRVFEHSGLEVVTPFDVCPEEGRAYSYYMGKDIEALLECDCIYMAKGWENSKGCMAEFEIARIYGKTIIM